MVFEMNASGVSDTLMVSEALAVLIPSVTCTVNVKEPTEVGVPDKIPLALKVMPGGNVPEATDQVIGSDLFCSSKS